MPAMSDIRALAHPRRLGLAAALGAYAAAIAVAPKPAGALVLAAPLAGLPLCYWAILKPHRWLPLFFAAALLLPPLPFGLGNSGPHPSLVLVGFGVLAGLWNFTSWRLPRASLNRALLTFFLVLLGSTAEAMFYSGPMVGLGSLARVMLFGISVYVFFYTAHGPGAIGPADPFAQARLLYWIAAASALFACVDFYFQFPAPAGFGPQFIWLASGVYRRAQGLFYEASTLGNFCAFFLVMIAAALLAPGRVSPLSRRAWLCCARSYRSLPRPTGCASLPRRNISFPRPKACFPDGWGVGARCSHSWRNIRGTPSSEWDIRPCHIPITSDTR